MAWKSNAELYAQARDILEGRQHCPRGEGVMICHWFKGGKLVKGQVGDSFAGRDMEEFYPLVDGVAGEPVTVPLTDLISARVTNLSPMMVKILNESQGSPPFPKKPTKKWLEAYDTLMLRQFIEVKQLVGGTGLKVDYYVPTALARVLIQGELWPDLKIHLSTKKEGGK